MRRLFTRAEIRERWDQEVASLIEKGVLSPDGHGVDDYLRELVKAKTCSDVIRIINELDPYDYKIVNAYTQDPFQHIGIFIKVKLEKDCDPVRIPQDPGSVFAIPKDTENRFKNNFSFINAKNIKVYDSEGSISANYK